MKTFKGPFRFRWILYVIIFFLVVFGSGVLFGPMSIQALSFGIGCLFLIFAFELLRDSYMGVKYGRGIIERLIDHFDMGFRIQGKKFLIEDHPIKLRIILNLPSILVGLYLLYIGMALTLGNAFDVLGYTPPEFIASWLNITMTISLG